MYRSYREGGEVNVLITKWQDGNQGGQFITQMCIREARGLIYRSLETA